MTVKTHLSAGHLAIPSAIISGTQFIMDGIMS
jgi:hypothetical protein